MNGEQYYLAALDLTDRHGKRFRDMLGDDFGCGRAYRQYFVGEYRDIELMGWATFRHRMLGAGQDEWLSKIDQLDEEVMLGLLERRLLEALEGRATDNGGRIINKDALDGAVKALQGMVSRSKAISEQAEASKSGTAEVIVKFIGSAGDPITGYGLKKIDPIVDNEERTDNDRDMETR